MANSPSAAVSVASTIVNASPFISSAGEYTNVNGTMNAAMPMREAASMVVNGLERAIPAAATAASAVGGVMSDTTP